MEGFCTVNAVPQVLCDREYIYCSEKVSLFTHMFNQFYIRISSNIYVDKSLASRVPLNGNYYYSVRFLVITATNWNGQNLSGH